MANHLSMANIQAVAALHRSGHSNRHIARVLGINRETVGKYVAQIQNQPNPQTGSGDGTVPSIAAQPAGPASSCEPHREQILTWLDAGLSIKRIHQDLCVERDYQGSYYSVWRFVARIQSKSPLPFRRIETDPGEELQIDFRTITRSRTLARPSDSTDQFWQAASELLDSALPPTAMSSGVRLIGMGISGMAAPRPVQLTLFDDSQAEQQAKHQSLDRLTDAVQARFGAAAIKRALGVQAASDDGG